MDTPDWISASECKTNNEAIARVSYLIKMGASPDWPRHWFRKISFMSPLRQPLAIELLTTADEKMDYPEHFVPMREKFVRWLNAPDGTPTPMDADDWLLLRMYQDSMESRIDSVLNGPDSLICD